jgi:hypothetical protein
MDTITESELEELEVRFNDGNRDEFITIAETFGWSRDVADQVWVFFTAGNLQKFPHDEV